MAFHHRKLLPGDEPDKKPDVDKKNDSSSPCYICYDCPVGCPTYLSPPPPYESAPSKHQISTTLILMLCVLGAAFLFLSYLTVVRYRSRRRNTRSTSFEGGDFREDFLDEDHGPVVDHPIWYIRTVGLPQSVIDSIVVFKYNKGEGLIEGRDCSVCLSEFQDDESLRLLPKCSHAFHLPCIDTWLRSHKNCPVCRAPVSVAAAVTSTDTGGVDVLETSAGGSGPREGNRTASNVLEGDERSDQTRGVGENSRPTPVEKLRVLSDLADNRRVNVDHELRSIRRCFSMDFASAPTNCTKKDEGCLDIKLMAIIEKQKLDMMAKRGSKNSSICDRLSKCSSHGRSIQKGPSSMKRSFSFSGKRSSRKHTRSLESIPIPESVCKIAADN